MSDSGTGNACLAGGVLAQVDRLYVGGMCFAGGAGDGEGFTRAYSWAWVEVETTNKVTWNAWGTGKHETRMDYFYSHYHPSTYLLSMPITRGVSSQLQLARRPSSSSTTIPPATEVAVAGSPATRIIMQVKTPELS